MRGTLGEVLVPVAVVSGRIRGENQNTFMAATIWKCSTTNTMFYRPPSPYSVLADVWALVDYRHSKSLVEVAGRGAGRESTAIGSTGSKRHGKYENWSQVQTSLRLR